MTIEHYQPADRGEWLALRQRDVTASEIPAILDIHPYKTLYQLWAEKSGRLSADNSDSATKSRGRRLQRLGAELAGEALPGATIEHNERNAYWRDPELRIGATPDVIVTHSNERGVIELKSIEPSIYARQWSGGEPPLHIALQTLCQAKLLTANWAAVGALRVGYGVDFDLIPIPIHEAAWHRICIAVADFWVMVEAGTPPPPDYARDASVIAELYRGEPGSVIDLSADDEFCAAIVERERLKRATRDFEKECKRLEGMIRHKAGEHETVLAGDWRVTFREENVAGYTVAASVRRRMRVKQLGGKE